MEAVSFGGANIEVSRASREFSGVEYSPNELVSALDVQGYVVVRSAVKPDLLLKTNLAFDEAVRSSTDCFQRQVLGKIPHVYTSHGYIKDGLMNIHDYHQRRYRRFKKAFLEVVTCEGVQSIVKNIFKESGRILHTMYFDANGETPAHRDSHSLDAEKEGGMVGIWIAAENINPEAGRFYLVEGSHTIEAPDTFEGGIFGKSLTTWVANSGLKVVAPVMECGDVIIFNSLTIHGSLPTANPQHSRRSITCHYSPISQGMTFFRSTSRDDFKEIPKAELKTITHNGVPFLRRSHAPISQEMIWRRKVKAHLKNRVRKLTKF